MGHIRLCSPGTASSHKSRITYYLAQIYSCIGSVDFPSQLHCAATVFFQAKVMVPLGAVERIKVWAGSHRRSGVNHQQPQLWFHCLCFGCGTGVSSCPVLPPSCWLVSCTPASACLQHMSVELHHHEPDRGADLAEETVHQTNKLSSWSDQFPSPVLSQTVLNLGSLSGYLFCELLILSEPMSNYSICNVQRQFMPSYSNCTKFSPLFPGENELQLTCGVTPRQVNQKEWMGLPQFHKEKALFIRKK